MEKQKDMKQYTILQPLYMAFYSQALYRDVAANWKGRCFGYLLLLLTVYWIPEMSRLHSDVSEFFTTEAPKIINQMPAITISHGEASVDKPVPYIVYYPDKDSPYITIDTSDKPASLDNSKAILLITKTKLFLKKSRTETSAVDLAPIENLVIDRELLYNWTELFRTWAPFIMFPFVLLFSWLVHILQVLLCASIGRSFAAKFNLDLSYKTLVRLSVIAFTPPIIFNALHAFLHISFPFSGPISFFFALGYLYYGVAANAGKDAKDINK